MAFAIAVLAAISCASCSKRDAAAVAPSDSAAARGSVQVIAQLVHKSDAPDPQKAEYPDCLIYCEFRVLEIQSTQRSPRHLLAALPAFRNRQKELAHSFVPGAIVKLDLEAAESAPREMTVMEFVDEIENLELPLYYALGVQKLSQPASAFAELPDSAFLSGDAKPASRAHARKPFVMPPAAAAERARVIAQDLDSIRAALARNGGSWEAWQKLLEPMHADLSTQLTAAGGLLRSGKHVFERLAQDRYKELCLAGAENRRGPISMLKNLHAQLRGRGVDLIVVPFPFKEEIDAHKFSKHAPDDGWHSPWRTNFILQLLEAGVEAVDLAPAMYANKPGHEHIYHADRDLHPAEGGIRIAAREIAARLERYQLRSRPERVEEKFITRETHYDFGKTTSGQPQRYSALQVLHANGSELQMGEHNDCPVVIMGDSFTVAPGPKVPSASIPAHLALHLGEAPCQLLSMGSSNKAMRLLAREGADFLAGRCALVFVFGPSRLFGSVSDSAGGGWDLYDLPPLRF